MHGQDRRSGGEARGGRTPRAETPAPGRAPGRPAPVGSPRAVLALQRAAGNAAVAEALERGRHEHGEGCGHGTPVQRSAVERVIGSAGTPLPSPVRQDMESRLGADFADVRLHTDEAARTSAAEVGARAYTSGNHVVLGAGGGDHHTLAHELTHVLQQREGPVAGTDNGSGLRVSDPSDRFEREAEANAQRVMAGPAPRAQETGHGTGPGTVTAPGTTTAPGTATASGTGTAASPGTVQRAPTQTGAGPAELGLMPGASAHEMGGGATRYTVPDRTGDAKALFRAMDRDEFNGLLGGALPQGAHYQGFATNRAYSESYITNKPGGPTHLVVFYRPALTDRTGAPVPDINTFLQSVGAGTKAEDDDEPSTAVGETAKYSREVHDNTRANGKADAEIEKLRKDLSKDRQDAGDDTNPHRHKAAERVRAKTAKIALLEAKRKHPAKGDAVKALNAELASGRYAWKLLTFKSSS
ncbi:DUF4157 domain-containing protein [Streptomyces sp. NPDC060243]|uniref:eCIS core domain-containing protein n=1 Tax=Streptomyces sp. NPDC060243 TaxID=3347081 RepID=UPI00366653D0